MVRKVKCVVVPFVLVYIAIVTRPFRLMNSPAMQGLWRTIDIGVSTTKGPPCAFAIFGLAMPNIVAATARNMILITLPLITFSISLFAFHIVVVFSFAFI